MAINLAFFPLWETVSISSIKASTVLGRPTLFSAIICSAFLVTPKIDNSLDLEVDLSAVISRTKILRCWLSVIFLASSIISSLIVSYGFFSGKGVPLRTAHTTSSGRCASINTLVPTSFRVGSSSNSFTVLSTSTGALSTFGAVLTVFTSFTPLNCSITWSSSSTNSLRISFLPSSCATVRLLILGAKSFFSISCNSFAIFNLRVLISLILLSTRFPFLSTAEMISLPPPATSLWVGKVTSSIALSNSCRVDIMSTASSPFPVISWISWWIFFILLKNKFDCRPAAVASSYLRCSLFIAFHKFSSGRSTTPPLVWILSHLRTDSNRFLFPLSASNSFSAFLRLAKAWSLVPVQTLPLFVIPSIDSFAASLTSTTSTNEFPSLGTSSENLIPVSTSVLVLEAPDLISDIIKGTLLGCPLAPTELNSNRAGSKIIVTLWSTSPTIRPPVCINPSIPCSIWRSVINAIHAPWASS